MATGRGLCAKMAHLRSPSMAPLPHLFASVFTPCPHRIPTVPTPYAFRDAQCAILAQLGVSKTLERRWERSRGSGVSDEAIWIDVQANEEMLVRSPLAGQFGFAQLERRRKFSIRRSAYRVSGATGKVASTRGTCRTREMGSCVQTGMAVRISRWSRA